MWHCLFLPERWYLAALWPQWERQLGRERRLLASTESAAITAPIISWTVTIARRLTGEDPDFKWLNVNAWSWRSMLTKCLQMSEPPAKFDSEHWKSQLSLRGGKRATGERDVCVCARVCVWGHIWKSVWVCDTTSQREREIKKRKGSNSTAELLTFHITHVADAPTFLFFCLSHSLPVFRSFTSHKHDFDSYCLTNFCGSGKSNNSPISVVPPRA